MKRKIYKPIMTYLKEGVSPKKLSVCIAFGVVLGIIPFVGVTTLLCAAVAFSLRLNIGVIQVVNYAVYPLQILLFIPFIKTGIYICDSDPLLYSSEDILGMVKENAFEVIINLGYTNVLGVVVWLVLAPILFAVIYYLTYYMFLKYNQFLLNK
ncbi:MAG: DUF2062 domain-containing protein [Cyclobacteriaceae bacterium]|nr:DUF2062 domain-containing protein [Cyclobacteriaceae bacterium]